MKIFLLILIIGFSANAAEVLRLGATQKVMAISHDSAGRWLAGDKACVIQEGRELACGEVIKVTEEAAILRLEAPNQDIVRGDFVKRKQKLRRPSALINSIEVKPEASDHGNVNFGITAGLSAGFNYFFPMVHFQYAPSTNFVIGAMPIYFRAATTDATVGAMGGFLTLNFFPKENFHGIWLQAGGGALSFTLTSATLVEKVNSPAGFATVGYRARFEENLTMGVAAGGQYIRDPAFESAELKSVNLQPLMLIDVGFVF